MAHAEALRPVLAPVIERDAAVPSARQASRHLPSRQKRAPPPVAFHWYLIAGGLLFVGTALILWAMGRALVCDCQSFRLWQGGPIGPENSQHLTDWYSILHIAFGMLFFAVMWRTSRHWPSGWLLVVAVFTAAGWEVVENTPWVIAEFGQGLAIAEYRGDSIPNALADMVFMLFGFFVALRLPGRWTIGLGLAAELATAVAIRDSLLIGTLMLLHRFDAVAAWQGSAGLR